MALATRAANCQTVGELAGYLSSIGSLNSLNKSSRSVVDKNVFPSSSKTVDNQSFTVRPSPSGARVRDQAKKQINCYNCGGNHFVNQCRKLIVKCVVCRKIGHMRESCPTRNENK